MVVPIGVRLGMTSEDDVGHNVRMTGAAEINLAISKGSRVTRRLEQGGLIHVACDVHPWMSGYIHVAKHPYYVVSESDGRFELTDVPAGTHQIRLWHEAWWKEQGKQPDPLVITRSVLVEADTTTELVFELPHPTPSRVAGVPSNKSGSKLR